MTMESEIQTHYEGANQALIDAYNSGIEDGRVGYVPVAIADKMAEALRQAKDILEYRMIYNHEIDSSLAVYQQFRKDFTDGKL